MGNGNEMYLIWLMAITSGAILVYGIVELYWALTAKKMANEQGKSDRVFLADGSEKRNGEGAFHHIRISRWRKTASFSAVVIGVISSI